MSTTENIASQVQTTYEQYKKIKTLVDVGYFLIDYVVTGGEVTKDVTHNNQINVSEIVVSLDNDVTRHEAISFKTKTPNTTYYLDYLSDGMYSFNTAHHSGSYLPIAEVTTDANGNVSVIIDKRGDIGGFRLRPGYEYPELNQVVVEVGEINSELIDMRTPASGYTPSIPITVVGDVTRELQTRFMMQPAYNWLINGNFSVNQRVVSGTVTLTAGQYGHDRWKAGSSGCTYTFMTANNVTTITILSGSLVQVIEGLSLISGTYTLSWLGNSQGKIGSGSFSPTGTKSSVTGGANLAIEFSVGTLSHVQLVFGEYAPSFQPRSYAEELALCQRYLFHLDSKDNKNTVFSLAQAISTNTALPYVQFPFKMRVPPTLLASPSDTFSVDSITITDYPSINQATRNGALLQVSVASGLVAGQCCRFGSNVTNSAVLIFDAEI